MITRSMPRSAKRPRIDVIASTTTINNLCDDDLREIFRYLSASELHVTTNVCRTFNRNARAELPSRYKVVDFSDYPDDYDPANNGFNLRQFAPVLQRFGSSIVSIGVYTREHSAKTPHLLNLLIRYCSKSLKSLRLQGIRFTSDMILKLRPILSRLEVLQLTSCTWKLEPLPTEMLSFCSELQEITICKNKDVTTTQIIRAIVSHIPQIEKIKVGNNRGNVSDFVETAKQLKRLTALKLLYIDCDEEYITPVLKELAAARVPLEHLQLGNFYSDAEFVNEMSKWKQLKMFGLEYADFLELADVLTILRNLSELTELRLCVVAVPAYALAEIVKCAPKLRKLEWILPIDFYILPRPQSFEIDVFSQILDVLANRKEKSPALLLSLDPAIELNVPDELRKANEGLLKISNDDKVLIC